MSKAAAGVLAPSSIEGADRDLARLAARSARLALLVEASSARADVRRSRARLLLLLLSLACPAGRLPRRPWYVPGAVARMGPAALLRAWGKAWEEVPCLRTLRRHLVALEGVFAIVRQPGERIPHLRAPGRAPRFPDTLHVLESEEDGAWWEREGREVLERHPELRRSPEAWRARFGSWRSLARSRQPSLFDPARAPLAFPGHERPPEDLEAKRSAARLVARALGRGPLELFEALHSAGAHVPVRAHAELLSAPARFARAAALYALALSRGDRVRDGWAWIRAALRRASPREGAAALARLGIDLSNPGGGRDWSPSSIQLDPEPLRTPSSSPGLLFSSPGANA